MVELVYIFDEKSYCECLKKGESIAQVQFKYFFVHKHTYTGHHDDFTPLAPLVRGNYSQNTYIVAKKICK